MQSCVEPDLETMLTASADDVRDKMQELQRQLCASLIERDDEVEALMLGLIAQEHVLLVGEPGTAKSMACELLTQAIDGGSIFSVLLSKFSTPEELFGPVSVAGLKHDRYERIVNGFMPTAEVVFVDECWKASSAILNTMLKLMNERVFVNGPRTMKCPLRLMVAASNEWPQGEELSAAFDRFLIRKVVRSVRGDANRDRLLFGDLPPVTARVTLDEIDLAAAAAASIPWSDDGKDALREILGKLRSEGVEPGDRRCRKATKLAQAAAWLSGSAEVFKEHLECLRWALWRVPGEQIDKSAEIVSRIANPVGAEVASVIAEVEDITSKMNPTNVDGNYFAGLKKLDECQKRLAELSRRNPSEKTNAAAKYAKERMVFFRMKASEI